MPSSLADQRGSVSFVSNRPMKDDLDAQRSSSQRDKILEVYLNKFFIKGAYKKNTKYWLGSQALKTDKSIINEE